MIQPWKPRQDTLHELGKFLAELKSRPSLMKFVSGTIGYFWPVFVAYMGRATTRLMCLLHMWVEVATLVLHAPRGSARVIAHTSHYRRLSQFYPIPCGTALLGHVTSGTTYMAYEQTERSKGEVKPGEYLVHCRSCQPISLTVELGYTRLLQHETS